MSRIPSGQAADAAAAKVTTTECPTYAILFNMDSRYTMYTQPDLRQ